ncbi:CD99 molecule isoform X2 [Scleropages formosus]|uniref:CD99 molecule n=1 Tax=Scleropages formosus TaxID=113540 RepID=A0A8C9VN36_SCLFO|nr:CD99 antigen-like protein 2 isoform X2 [Scleropages formosus]
MKSCFWILFFATFALRALPQEGFDLSDAFGDDDNPAPTKRPEKPKSGGGGSAGDFDLFDAFGPDPTPRPPAKDPKKPAGGGFDLNDAFGPDPETQKPKVVVPKDGGTGGGSFGDSDLEDIGNDGSYKPDPGRGGGGGGGGGGADEPQAAGSGQIAGIVSAVGVALLGAASSYFAYQKKKLCFKIQGGDPESGHRDQSGTRSDPQVLSNLLRIS